MTQSKDNNIEITSDDTSFTIKLDETYGATTSYIDGIDSGSVVYSSVDSMADTITLDLSDITLDGIVDTNPGQYNFNWTYEQKEFENCLPGLDEVNKMCEVYPGLAKAYENFKTAYKLVEQDYKGKKKAGEIDDDIPF